MRVARLVPLLAFALAVGGLAAPYAAAAPRSAAAPAAEAPRPLRPARRYRPTGRLQVRFKAGVGATRQHDVLARVRAAGHGVHVDRSITALNAALLSVDSAGAVQRLLRADPAVAYVEAESRYRPLTADPDTNELTAVGADSTYHATNTGTGTEIAVIDSKVDATNADLDGVGKVIYAGDFSTDDPSDTNDVACTPAVCPHGTAVADVAAGEDGDGNMVGVAPGAVIRSYNVFRRTSSLNQDNQTEYAVGASSADIADALVYIGTNIASTPNLVAVNMSLGGPFDSQVVRDAIAYLHSHAPNVVVVVAAGNDARELADYPAGDPYVLSVGATGQVSTSVSCPSTPPDPNTPWTVTSFSNRGDVDVVAPGRCVTAWYPSEDNLGAITGPPTLTKVDGTSFAAPMTAGTLALLAAATGIKGDAARAAVMAGANHASPDIASGLGQISVAGAVDVANGPESYTAMSVERGGQVASVVGRRNVEVLRVTPGASSPPTAPIPTVTSGFGSVTASASAQDGSDVTVGRRTGTFSVPSTAKSGTFTLTATGGVGNDTSAVPMKMLDSADGPEGVPAADGEKTNTPLTYAARTSYVRSAYVDRLSELDWAWTFDQNGWMHSADLLIWEPSVPGGTANAAFEPVASEYDGTSGQFQNMDGVVPEVDTGCGHPCHKGRWLVGWMTFGNGDSSNLASGDYYRLQLTYFGPTVTATVPALASSASTNATFPVVWGGGNNAVKWDVYYATKSKVGSSWVQGPWTLWKNHTTGKSATFGGSNLPVAPAKGQTYYFLVRAFDVHENPSLPAVRSTAVPLDDYTTAATYSASFTGGGAAGRYFGSIHKSAVKGGNVTVTWETQQFSIVGDKCAACGQFQIWVDGAYKGIFDTYASSTLTRQVLYKSGIYSGGVKSHTLKLVVYGTANRAKVVVDAFGAAR